MYATHFLVRTGVRLAMAASAAAVLAAAWPVPAAHAGQLTPVTACDWIAGQASTYVGGVDARVTALAERDASSRRVQAARRAEQDATRSVRLEAAHRRLTERAAALNPSSDVQRDAVAAFVSTVRSALDARREAIDEAVAAFRTGVDDASDAALDEMRAIFSRHRDTLDVLIARARSDCARGAPPSAIRDTLQSGLAAARAALESALAARPALQARIEPHHRALRDALDAAEAAFREAVRAAAAVLKQRLR